MAVKTLKSRLYVFSAQFSNYTVCRAVPERHFFSTSDLQEGREERQENHGVDLCEITLGRFWILPVYLGRQEGSW